MVLEFRRKRGKQPNGSPTFTRKKNKRDLGVHCVNETRKEKDRTSQSCIPTTKKSTRGIEKKKGQKGEKFEKVLKFECKKNQRQKQTDRH